MKFIITHYVIQILLNLLFSYNNHTNTVFLLSMQTYIRHKSYNDALICKISRQHWNTLILLSQHTPMTCTYLQSFDIIHECVFKLQCENQMWWTDRQIDGREHFNISCPGLEILNRDSHCLYLQYGETTVKGSHIMWRGMFQYFKNS